MGKRGVTYRLSRYAAVCATEPLFTEGFFRYVAVFATESSQMGSFTELEAISVVFLQCSPSFRASCQVSVAVCAMGGRPLRSNPRFSRHTLHLRSIFFAK